MILVDGWAWGGELPDYQPIFTDPYEYQQMRTGDPILEAAKVGAGIGAWAVPGGASLAGGGLKGALTAGAAAGGLGGMSMAEDWGDVPGQTLKGAGLGAAFGGALYGAGKGVGALAKKYGKQPIDYKGLPITQQESLATLGDDFVTPQLGEFGDDVTRLGLGAEDINAQIDDALFRGDAKTADRLLGQLSKYPDDVTSQLGTQALPEEQLGLKSILKDERGFAQVARAGERFNVGDDVMISEAILDSMPSSAVSKQALKGMAGKKAKVVKVFSDNAVNVELPDGKVVGVHTDVLDTGDWLIPPKKPTLGSILKDESGFAQLPPWTKQGDVPDTEIMRRLTKSQLERVLKVDLGIEDDISNWTAQEMREYADMMVQNKQSLLGILKDESGFAQLAPGDDLAAQAAKFDNVDDFVKSQLDKAKKVKMYRTSKSGVRHDDIKDFTFFSPSKEHIKQYLREGDKIVEYELNPLNLEQYGDEMEFRYIPRNDNKARRGLVKAWEEARGDKPTLGSILADEGGGYQPSAKIEIPKLGDMKSRFGETLTTASKNLEAQAVIRKVKARPIATMGGDDLVKYYADLARGKGGFINSADDVFKLSNELLEDYGKVTIDATDELTAQGLRFDVDEVLKPIEKLKDKAFDKNKRAIQLVIDNVKKKVAETGDDATSWYRIKQLAGKEGKWAKVDYSKTPAQKSAWEKLYLQLNDRLEKAIGPEFREANKALEMAANGQKWARKGDLRSLVGTGAIFSDPWQDALFMGILAGKSPGGAAAYAGSRFASSASAQRLLGLGMGKVGGALQGTGGGGPGISFNMPQMNIPQINMPQGMPPVGSILGQQAVMGGLKFNPETGTYGESVEGMGGLSPEAIQMLMQDINY